MAAFHAGADHGDRIAGHGSRDAVLRRWEDNIDQTRRFRGTVLDEHLFDENEDTLSNLLDVHVSNVRRKLGKDFIVTRRGQGYAIDV